MPLNFKRIDKNVYTIQQATLDRSLETRLEKGKVYHWGDVCFVNRKQLMLKHYSQEVTEPGSKSANCPWPFSHILIIITGMEEKCVRNRRSAISISLQRG